MMDCDAQPFLTLVLSPHPIQEDRDRWLASALQAGFDFCHECNLQTFATVLHASLDAANELPAELLLNTSVVDCGP